MTNDTLMMNNPITLAELLTAKEQRAALQKTLIKQYSKPLISLTITMPGAIKLTPCVLFLFNQACQQIETYYRQNQIKCLNVVKKINSTGPEGFFILDKPELDLKKAFITLENTHPLGRLWDIDVISTTDYTALSRRTLNYPTRKCLICGNDAKACARARIHTTTELVEKIESIAKLEGYVNDDIANRY